MDAMMNPCSNRRMLTAAAALTALAVLINTSVSASENQLPACEHQSQTPPDPSQPQPPPTPPQLEPTTITAIGQVYYCIFDNYFGGPTLDDRSLLLPAFAGLTQQSGVVLTVYLK
jgi:carboxyl-terminal processing protease